MVFQGNCARGRTGHMIKICKTDFSQTKKMWIKNSSKSVPKRHDSPLQINWKVHHGLYGGFSNKPRLKTGCYNLGRELNSACPVFKIKLVVKQGCSVHMVLLAWLIIRFYLGLPVLLEDKPHPLDENIRRVERGSRIVVAVTQDTKVVLQVNYWNWFSAVVSIFSKNSEPKRLSFVDWNLQIIRRHVLLKTTM